MIKNRFVSFAIILIVYIIAVTGGIFFYDFLANKTLFSFYLMILLADIFATAIVFLFSSFLNNSSVYDPYGSVQPPVIMCVAISRCGGNLFVWLIFAAILLWALRLTANWAYTFTNLGHQDWRYSMLKEKTGRFYPLVNFLGIHLFPTIVVYLCIMPVIITIHNGVEFNLLCIPFIALSFIAPIFQGIADIQMHIFRKSGTGGFIRSGLWKKSRHPNYACEILMWWGIDFACFFAMPYNWVFLIGALVNTLMFLFISIPMADKHQSRKPGFEEYKKATRML